MRKVVEDSRQIKFGDAELLDQKPLLFGEGTPNVRWICPHCYKAIQTATKYCPNCKVTFDWSKVNEQTRNASKIR